MKVLRKNKSDTATTINRSWRVDLLVRKQGARVKSAQFKRILCSILTEIGTEGLPPTVCSVSVVFTNDPDIHQMNREYRGKDKPTDVLSFSQIEGDLGGEHSESLGDLVISTDTALRQARERSHTLAAEVLRLLVHGVLHLYGYDHEGVPAKEAQRMRRKERALARKYHSEFRGVVVLRKGTRKQ